MARNVLMQLRGNNLDQVIIKDIFKSQRKDLLEVFGGEFSLELIRL